MWTITDLLFLLFVPTIVLEEVVGRDQMNPVQGNEEIQPIFPFKWLKDPHQSKEMSTNGIDHQYIGHQGSINNHQESKNILPSFVFEGRVFDQDAFEVRSNSNEDIMDRPLRLYRFGNEQENRNHHFLGRLVKTAPKQGKKVVNLLVADDEIGEVDLNADEIIDGKMVYRFGKKFAVERGGEKNRLHRWISKRSTANDFMRKPPRAG